jgi:hypothetical protein
MTPTLSWSGALFFLALDLSRTTGAGKLPPGARERSTSEHYHQLGLFTPLED